MASIAAAIAIGVGTFIAGCAAIKLVYDGISLIVSSIYSLIMRYSSNNVTTQYINDMTNVHSEVQKQNPDAHMSQTTEQFKNQLTQYKGQACVIDNKVWHWTQETQRSVNLILDEKESDEKRKETYRLFVNTCFDFVSKAISGAGATNVKENFDSFDPNDKITAILKYDLRTKLLKLVFSFTGGKEFFDFIRILLETLKREGIRIDMNKYEKEFQDFKLDEDGASKYVLKLQG